MPESTNGLPDVVGLESLVSSPQENAPVAPPQDQQAPPTLSTETNAGQTPTEEFDLAQFKTPKDLLKGYKEVQGAFTRTTQENKALKDKLTSLEAQFNEQMELMRLQNVRPHTPPPQPKDFDAQFIENPRGAVESLAEQKAASMLIQSKIQDVLEEESLKAPQEFQERYAYARSVAQQYPNLVTSTAGVRKLFQLADKVRSEHQRQQAYKAVTAVFGDDVDLEKLKTLLKKPVAAPNQPNLAYMPDTTSTRTGAESGSLPDFSSAVAQAAQKGDVDSTLTNMFKGLGLKT